MLGAPWLIRWLSSAAPHLRDNYGPDVVQILLQYQPHPDHLQAVDALMTTGTLAENAARCVKPCSWPRSTPPATGCAHRRTDCERWT